MEIIFLIVGLAVVALGIAIIVSEARSRLGTEPVGAHVIGFSLGRSINPNLSSFHPVAEYVGHNGQKYFIEGSVGSSVPLHSVGQTVTVLTNPAEPEKAVFKSALSYVLGVGLAAMGVVPIAVFWTTFRPDTFSLVTAAVVLVGLAVKIKSLWRKETLSLEAWKAYKKTILSTHVFTNESKDQIRWADPMRLASATELYRKTNRFAVPVLLALGLGLLFLSYHFHEKTDAFLQTANATVGTVVELRERNSGDGESTFAAVVEYGDDRGTQLTFVDSLSSSPPSYRTGDKVQVLFNRENPNEAQIDRGLGNYWAAALFGVLGALFLLMGMYSARRKFSVNSALASQTR